MNGKHEAKPSARVASRQTIAKGNTRAPRLLVAVAGKGKKPAAIAGPSYEQLLHFFNESRDLLCIAGLDGKFKRLNPAWHTAMGWTLEELQARPFLDFVYRDDRTATLAEMSKLATGVATTSFENRYHCKDGSWKWLHWTANPLPNRREIYAIARDVTEQKRLEKEVLDTLDLERERMGRELHDGLCQNLAGIAALIAALERNLTRAAAREAAAAREIGRLIGRAIVHARDLARGLDPLQLQRVGLVGALEDFCSNTAAVFEISCRFRCEHCPLMLDGNCELNLYRIVQEAVNNAIAHGQAKRIEASLAFKNGQGRLAIRDDGSGIGDPLDGHRRGIGIHTMAYRARVIGGSLELNRRTPRGTVVTCVFPLPPATPSP